MKDVVLPDMSYETDARHQTDHDLTDRKSSTLSVLRTTKILLVGGRTQTLFLLLAGVERRVVIFLFSMIMHTTLS